MLTRKIMVREFVEDVRSGTADAELMSKYGLSQKQLFEVYEKLLEAKKLALEDLERQDSNGETIAGPAAKCSQCGAGKASETDLCPQCGAGDTLTVVDRKRRQEVPAGPGKPDESAGKKRAPVFDTQVMEARLDVSRAARVHPEWMAPSGQYDLGEYAGQGSRGRRRLLSAKQIVYLFLGAAFLAAIVFLCLAFYDEIESYVIHWRQSAPKGGLQSAVIRTDRHPAPPAGGTRQDRLQRDVTSGRPPVASGFSESPELGRIHRASHKHEEESPPRESAAASSISPQVEIGRTGELSETKVTPGTELPGKPQPYDFSSGVAADKVDPAAEARLDQRHRARTSNDEAPRSPEHSSIRVSGPAKASESSVPSRVTTVTEKPADRETPRGEASLIDAVREGDTVRAAELIAAGVDINAADDRGVTVLLHAARKGNVPLIRLLLAKGADVRRKDYAGSSALDAALQARDEGTVGLILPYHRERGEAILLKASADGRNDLVEVLLANGVDPNTADELGNTALMKAAGTGRVDIARLLLEKGADTQVANKEGATALGYAYAPSATASVSLSAQREMVQLLKQHQPGLRALGKRGD